MDNIQITGDSASFHIGEYTFFYVVQVGVLEFVRHIFKDGDIDI